MKKITLTLATLFFVTMGMMAQEVVSEKKETLTKSTTLDTKVVKEVKKEKQVKKLKEDGSANQKSIKKVVSTTDDQVITKNSAKNNESKAAMAKMKADRQAEIQKKRDDLLDRARKEGRLVDNDKEAAKRAKKLEEQKKKYAERKKNATKKKKDNH